MPKINTVTKRVSVEMEHNIEHFHVIGDKHAVKISINCTPDDIPWFIQKLKPESKQVILTTENLENLLARKEYKTEPSMVVVPDDFLAIAQENGYVYATEEFKLGYNTVFDDCKDINGKHLITDYRYGHMLFAHDGTVLPTAIKFRDYCFSDGRYAIYDLHKTLSELPKTVLPFLTEIMSIPYYNETPDQSIYISATFQPTAEQMITIWEKAQILSEKYPSSHLVEAVIELDILGIAKHEI
jgi:hypothetical protein